MIIYLLDLPFPTVRFCWHCGFGPCNGKCKKK